MRRSVRIMCGTRKAFSVIFRMYTVGDYSLWSEYTDIYEPEKTGTAADYVGIEMSIASE